MAVRSLDDWLRYQLGLKPERIKLGLDRCRLVADAMGLLEPPCPVLTVAGTNGKGSSISMTEAILRAAGYRTGAYTSPHVQRYNERVRIDGEEADDEALVWAFEQVEAARGATELTYFEYGTLAAMLLFHGASLDAALLEVGLGGRLDAVNVFDADSALVTTVDIDHVRWLGSDRESIGREKAGIFRSGRPAICADPAPPRSVPEYAASIDALYLQAGADFGCHPIDAGGRWVWSGAGGVSLELPTPAMSGAFQMRNAAGVLTMLESLSHRLPVTPEDIARGLVRARLPGRMEARTGTVTWLLDVAHNPQSAGALADAVAESYGGRTVHGVVGMLADKDLEKTLCPLAPILSSWHVADLGTERGSKASDLALAARAVGAQGPIEQYAGVDWACAGARRMARDGDLILVFGSFHTVEQARALATLPEWTETQGDG